MKTKIISFVLLFIMLILNCSSVFATTTNSTVEASKTTFELVDKSTCEMDLSNMGHFTKELTNFDKEKRELTITLTVTNTAKKEERTKPVELFLVLDNSHSMVSNYQGKQKMKYVAETATSFVDALFNHFSNIKVGLVGFSSVDPLVTDESGNKPTLGTINDATLLTELTNSENTVKSAITSYLQKVGPYTNMEAGLALAEKNFTTNKDAEKYIVLISDSVPNLSLDTEHTLTYSGVNSENTKNQLQNLSTKGYQTYSILMGYSDNDVPNPSAPMIADGSRHMTYSELAEEILGTTDNPNAGKFYFIDYENLNDTITKDIYNDIIEVKDNSLKNIVIKDYIPQDIMENFDFEYVVKPNIGTASDKVDTKDNSFTWTIPTLAEGETATLSYKLKLKATVNKDILNKVLPTNTKVDISFETPDGKKSTVSSDVSPKVKITYEEPKKPEPKPDNTEAPKPLPQTGNYTGILVTIAIVGTAIFAVSRLKGFKK